MSRELLVVFSYDISAPKQRRKAARILEQVATRVQGSVFEARLKHEHAMQIAQQVEREMSRSDSLRVYVIAANSEPKCYVSYGAAPLEEREGFWLL